jgi:hypothetical protein
MWKAIEEAENQYAVKGGRTSMTNEGICVAGRL